MIVTAQTNPYNSMRLAEDNGFAADLRSRAQGLATVGIINETLTSVRTLNDSPADAVPGEDIFLTRSVEDRDLAGNERTLKHAIFFETDYGSSFEARARIGDEREPVKMSREEVDSEIVYRLTYETPRKGPNTTEVVVDKASGTMEVQGYFLSYVPDPRN